MQIWLKHNQLHCTNSMYKWNNLIFKLWSDGFDVDQVIKSVWLNSKNVSISYLIVNLNLTKAICYRTGSYIWSFQAQESSNHLHVIRCLCNAREPTWWAEWGGDLSLHLTVKMRRCCLHFVCSLLFIPTFFYLCLFLPLTAVRKPEQQHTFKNLWTNCIAVFVCESVLTK